MSTYFSPLFSLVVCGGLCFFPVDMAFARRTYPKIVVKEALRVELNSVLKAASDLHQACFKQDELAIESSVKKLQVHLGKARSRTTLAPERQHLLKILLAAEENLDAVRVKRPKTCTSLDESFRQLVQIVRVFKVDKYQVFFCSKDKKVWLQKGWKAQNPFHPVRYKNCGKLG